MNWVRGIKSWMNNSYCRIGRRDSSTFFAESIEFCNCINGIAENGGSRKQQQLTYYKMAVEVCLRPFQKVLKIPNKILI